MGDTASSSKGSRPEVSKGSDLTRETRGAAFAPVRMIAGLVVGGLISLLLFGIAWSRFWPSGLEPFASFIVLLSTVTFVGAGLGAAMWSIQPIRRWYQIGIVVLIGAVLGGWIGLQLKGVLLETCLHGTGPQERWCSPEYSFTGVTAASAAAGAVTLFLLSGVAVNRRAIERREATDSAISSTNIG